MNRHSSKAMMMRVHQAESVPWKVMKVWITPWISTPRRAVSYTHLQQKQPEDLLSQPDLPGRAPGQQGLYGGQIRIGLNLLSQKDILH